MSIKGSISNLWTNTIDVLGTKFKQTQQYASLAQQADQIYGLRTAPKGVGLVASGLLIDAADPSGILSKDVLPVTAHALEIGHTLRFTTGLLIGQEATVIAVPDVNTVIVAGLASAPALGDQYTQLQPVTQTFDLSGNTFVTQAARTVVDTMDIPLMVPAAAGDGAIPAAGGAFLEIVASTAAPIFELMMSHDMGEFVNLYTGAAAAETFLCHLPLTPDERVPVTIAAGTRLSIQAGKAVAIDDITSAYEINFIG